MLVLATLNLSWPAIRLDIELWYIFSGPAQLEVTLSSNAGYTFKMCRANFFDM